MRSLKDISVRSENQSIKRKYRWHSLYIIQLSKSRNKKKILTPPPPKVNSCCHFCRSNLSKLSSNIKSPGQILPWGACVPLAVVTLGAGHSLGRPPCRLAKITEINNNNNILARRVNYLYHYDIALRPSVECVI